MRPKVGHLPFRRWVGIIGLSKQPIRIMAQELIYTSAPRGLLPGSSGFCTVARTAGMSPVLVGHLESRSGYRHLFPPQSEKAALNPVNWSHEIIRIGQTPTHILSRIADAGLDYTKRSNVIAHHLILKPEELSPCGPAAVLAQPDLMLHHWEIPPTEFPKGRPIPNPSVPSLKCVHWERLTGDAGWGGMLAESVSQSRSVCILFQPGTDLLSLFAESIAILPESLRWKITFSTYLREASTGANFLWKGILAGTPEAKQMQTNKSILLLDLATIGRLSPKADSSFVKIARTGVVVPPQKDPGRDAVVLPPVASTPQAGPVEVPAIHGDAYDIIETPTKKRNRPHVGMWSSKYESQAVSAEKERRARRTFYTIICFASLAILIFLTLLCDELFNSGGMRKVVLQSFAVIGKHNQDIQNAAEPNPQPVPPDVLPIDPAKEPSNEEIPPEENPVEIVEQSIELTEEEKQIEEERLRLEEEERTKKEEEEQAEKQRRQKELEEEIAKRKDAMQAAFAAIPDSFALVEPKVKAFGGIELGRNRQKEFALLFTHRDYLQMQWIPLIAPKGWAYHLEEVPRVFLDDPYAQWNLIAHFVEGGENPTQRTQKSLNLATISLGEENGLEIEWKQQTAGVESNLEVVNKLPFSYLRLSFGPNATTELGPGKEKKTIPIPKRFMATDELAAIDFTASTWFKDVSLWEPMRNRPFVVSDKSEINRPANPVMKFDNVFGRDRFRVGLGNINIQSALLLEVSVKPETAKNLTVTTEASDSPWEKTISFAVDSSSSKKASAVIPISAAVFPNRIEFRDVSQDQQADAIKQRTALTKTIKEKTDELNNIKPQSFSNPDLSDEKARDAFESHKRSLGQEIDGLQQMQTQVNERFQAIPAARKSVFAAGLSIHYSVYLQGVNGTERMLILTTSAQ